MAKSRTSRPTSPQVVATLSSLLLLLVSLALGFYFMELRGPGIRTLLSGSQASEVLVLLGGLAAVLLTGHLAVGNAARSAQGTRAFRALARRAAEVDRSDPQALQPFDAVPELRDLVGVLIAEKNQGQQLQDALESARGESRGLLEGMERSLKDQGRMREDHPSELGRKVATLWNSMIERVQDLEARGAVPATSSVSSEKSAASIDVEERLRELEARVCQLQSALRTANIEDELLVTEAQGHTSGSLLAPEGSPEVVDLEERVDPVPSLVMQDEDEGPGAQELETFAEEFDEVDVSVDNTFAESPARGAPTFAGPWSKEAPTKAAAPQPPRPAPVAPTVADSADEEDTSEHTYSEWGGKGFAELTPAASQESSRFAATPGERTTAAEGPARGITRMQFPEFRSQPRPTDRVDVTYEGSTHAEPVADLRGLDDSVDSAIVEEEANVEIDDEVVDLKSLGALETRE